MGGEIGNPLSGIYTDVMGGECGGDFRNTLDTVGGPPETSPATPPIFNEYINSTFNLLIRLKSIELS